MRGNANRRGSAIERFTQGGNTMRFLACVLTLEHHSAQEPLLFAEYVQLRQDLVMAFFPSEHACPHLLTVACLRSDHQQTVLRLTLAEQQNGTLSQLVHRIHSGQPILLCQRRGEIRTFDMSDPIWTGMSTWADIQTPQGNASFRFNFATPLITALPLVKQSLDALPFPEPETVFARAVEQWQSLSGPSFPAQQNSSSKQRVVSSPIIAFRRSKFRSRLFRSWDISAGLNIAAYNDRPKQSRRLRH
jgi:hypothetical protein